MADEPQCRAGAPSGPAPSRRPTTRRLLVSAGVLCLGLAGAGVATNVGPAGADAPPGSGFLSFGLTATAPGSQFTYDYPGATPSPQAEGEVPQSIAQLQGGPQGYALATLAWPGPLAANAGSTSQLLNLGLPSSVSDNANDPVRAEARTGSGPPSVTNNSYPGVSMTATATGTKVDSDATMAGFNGPAPQSGSGNTETHSVTELTGPSSAVATASSVVHNIKLAGGVVTISSVTSNATGTTDGNRASGTGGTTVSGLVIGGQPAYVDQQGVHLGQGGPGAPVNSVASTIANQALQGAGMKIAVSQPVTRVQGAQVTYDAGNLVVYWAPPGDTHGDTFTATFGGASVTATASPGFTLPTALTLPSAAAPLDTGSSTAALAAPELPLSTGAPAAPAATAPSPAAPAPVVPLATARPAAALPRGLSPVLPVLAVLGALLMAAGLRRLPDRVLAGSTPCPDGGRR